MGKSFATVALVIFAFCFTSTLAFRQGGYHLENKGVNPAPVAGAEDFGKVAGSATDKFLVQGKVYCDPCQFEFESRLSKPLSGVKVILECRKPESDEKTFSQEATADANGFYALNVVGNHEDEICAVRTEVNTHKHCNLPMKTSDSDRIVLTKHDGVSSALRFVNPLGFKTQKINDECAKVYKELELDTIDN
ncbi:unnamed protein product [Lupinus luteus]|uniref:Pollen allergen Ole e 1 family n=1 Tax=Lupinus luteus TaxID=3873 RepID=A0AAV1WM82_LUPLU